jgi:hypothetical protein
VSRLEIEGHDLISGDTVEMAVWAEAQTSGVAEEYRPVRYEPRPLVLSYSRMLEIASRSPKGHSLDTTMLLLGAMVRSRGLSCESSTKRGARSWPSASNTLIVSSPTPEGLIPDAKKIRPSGANANPLGNGTTFEGRYGMLGPSRLAGIAMMVRRRREPTS